MSASTSEARSSAATQSQAAPQVFFEAVLQYQPSASPAVSTGDRIGKLLGSGDGRITGEQLNGTVRWSIFEIQEKTVCQTNLAGVITTDDGAEIAFDSQGFGATVDPSRQNIWKMVAALQFRTEDARYKWLNHTLATWQGEFDMSTGQHRYRAFK